MSKEKKVKLKPLKESKKTKTGRATEIKRLAKNLVNNPRNKDNVNDDVQLLRVVEKHIIKASSLKYRLMFAWSLFVETIKKKYKILTGTYVETKTKREPLTTYDMTIKMPDAKETVKVVKAMSAKAKTKAKPKTPAIKTKKPKK